MYRRPRLPPCGSVKLLGSSTTHQGGVRRSPMSYRGLRENRYRSTLLRSVELSGAARYLLIDGAPRRRHGRAAYLGVILPEARFNRVDRVWISLDEVRLGLSQVHKLVPVPGPMQGPGRHKRCEHPAITVGVQIMSNL